MNKTLVSLVQLLIIFCVGSGQILLSFASYTPARTIATFGTIEPSTRIYKHIVAYGYTSGFTDEQIEFISSHFDVLDIAWSSNPTGIKESVAELKQRNPELIIIVYISAISAGPAITYYGNWTEINLHEDWFLHDLDGNRLQIAWESGWYAMDMRNQGWREHLADWCIDLLNDCPQIDGIFCDNAWVFLRTDDFTVPRDKIPSEYGEGWYEDMRAFLQYIKSRMGRKLLIINTEDNTEYVDVADGKMQEGFIHANWESSNYFNSAYMSDFNALNEISKKDKYYMAYGGTKFDGTEDDYHRIMLYCLTFYLLGYHGDKATFGFLNFHYSNRGYWEEVDGAKQMGSPVNEYYSIGSVYARDFAEGKVLVNPTSSSYTVDLESEYKTLDGQTVSNITLYAHSGIILLKP